MSSRNLSALIGAALLILIAALWIGYARSPRTAENEALYPELKGKLGNISGVSIFKAGDELGVELARDNGAWKVKQRHDYPADAGKVHSLLINLETATLREQKTANTANYVALGVEDLSDSSGAGVRVELTAATPFKLIVGKRDSATRSTYVRRAGEAQSWLVGVELEVSADATQWLKRDIFSVGADRIQEAGVHLAGGSPYSSVKAERTAANFDVNGLPRGRELNSHAVANAAAQALTSLQLDDVRPAKELVGEKTSDRAVFRTFDGLVVESVGYKTGDQRWVTFQARFDIEQAKRFHVPTPATVEADKAKAPATPVPNPSLDGSSFDSQLKKGQDEAAEINARVNGWAYALPAFKYDAIFKPLDDLLKKPDLMKK